MVKYKIFMQDYSEWEYITSVNTLDEARKVAIGYVTDRTEIMISRTDRPILYFITQVLKNGKSGRNIYDYTYYCKETDSYESYTIIHQISYSTGKIIKRVYSASNKKRGRVIR